MKGWKTIIFNVLSGATVLLGGEQVVSVLGPQWTAFIIAAVNIVLRYLTTTPVGSSEPVK